MDDLKPGDRVQVYARGRREAVVEQVRDGRVLLEDGDCWPATSLERVPCPADE
jgi:membrane protein implicated in regulation of membrane protease activity